MVLTAVAALPRGFVVASVIGFPSGAHVASIKAQEAERACADGAREIDMVVNLAAVAQAQWQTVANEVAQVRREIGNNVVLKVIVESALWSDAQVISTCTAAVDGGADFVKTSTGFHTSGGATARVVRIMRGTVGTDLGVKASGGIRSLATTLEMLEAGANRIGTSSARIILDEAEQKFGIDKQ
jgi:deoxyribose-phosphate aldolase